MFPFSAAALCFLACSTVPLAAATIAFDDIDASAGDVILGTYQGYSFTNFSAYTTVPGFPGFNNGIVSGPNAAYSSDTGTISSTKPFDFTGAAFGSGYYDGLQLTIEGLRGGTIYDTRTITVSTTGAKDYSFAFTSIDELLFTTSTTASTTDPYYCGAVGCSYFTIDNAVLTPDMKPPPPPPPPPPPNPVPEPSTLTLFALGLAALLPLKLCRFGR